MRFWKISTRITTGIVTMTASQVVPLTSNVERYSKSIPAALWLELRADSLLPDSPYLHA